MSEQASKSELTILSNSLAISAKHIHTAKNKKQKTTKTMHSHSFHFSEAFDIL